MKRHLIGDNEIINYVRIKLDKLVEETGRDFLNETPKVIKTLR